MNAFFQDPPQLGNPYTEDRLLAGQLRRLLPADVLAEVDADVTRFGERVLHEVTPAAADAEAHPPVYVPFDPWGRRIDEIQVAPGWQRLAAISAEEGLVATGYERRHGPYSRLHQFAKLYVFNPSSAVFTCPLAMADGAARLLETHGDASLKSHAFRRLTTRDPKLAWTSGQWMTERTGGSDVGRTETIARLDGDTWRLSGTKWFTSATTSEMAITLARTEATDGSTTAGSRGLSAFYVETRDPTGQLNRIHINRLKDKLGTRALPTAELELDGTPARMIGPPGRGVATIVTLVNVTRLYNAICAVSGARRGLMLARDYARRREAFGRPLAEQPAHLATLANLEIEIAGGLALTLHAIGLLGREECGLATAEEAATLRLLTPLAKLWTGKLAVAVASEVLECFGGAGYVEDTGLPKLLRDAQVLPIWEGTTNVLSLDALRAIDREAAFGPFVESLRQGLQDLSLPELRPSAERVVRQLAELEQFLVAGATAGREALEAGARGFALRLARAAASVLLLQQAQWSAATEQDGRPLLLAERFIAAADSTLDMPDERCRQASAALALDLDWPLAPPAANAPSQRESRQPATAAGG
ncbi:MAG: acyl-CoA dehydrogenase family protein [Pirellulales bacterium]|nr:acyl-CoA dehydrogenase family protein [Pirellulales bacterium]